MRVLLDTHILLWLLNDSILLPKPADDLLPKPADEIIFNPSNLVFVSSISLWEIAIKTGLGKLELEVAVADLEAICERSNLIVMGFHADHALAVENLPMYHKDPFDRALIVQAQLEQMTLLTHDTVLGSYGKAVLVV
jgi:PIN domain nuclease of toxin-antitoxin system